jgi:hypothetical protein
MVASVSTSLGNSHSKRTSTRRDRKSRRVLIIVCSILSAGLIAAVILIKGNVSGIEFAPSHFQTRSFSFYEIPFLHLQITPVNRKTTTNKTARQIRTSAWINAPRGQAPSNWHIVELSRGPTRTPAIASLLVETLDLSDSSGLFWHQWNQDHPQRAAILWPIVQRLAERELYVLIPELLQLARTLPGDDSPAELQDAIDPWLIQQYGDLIGDLSESGQGELAGELYQEAVTDFPEAKQQLRTKLASSSQATQ